MKDLKNYNLLAHNTFGIAGLCRRFVEFGDVDDVQTFVRTLTETDRPLLIIGAEAIYCSLATSREQSSLGY